MSGRQQFSRIGFQFRSVFYFFDGFKWTNEFICPFFEQTLYTRVSINKSIVGVFMNRSKFVLLFTFLFVHINLTAFQENVILHENKIFSKGAYYISCNIPDSGKKIWHYRHSPKYNSLGTSFAVNRSIVLFNDMKGFIYAISIETGRLKWKKKHNMGKSIYFTQNGLKGRRLYFTSSNFTVGYLDMQSRHIIRQKKIYGLMNFPPVVSGNNIFCKIWKGNVISLQKNNLRINWKKQIDFQPYVPFLLVKNRVFIAAKKNVVCLNTANGQIIWKRKFTSNSYGNLLHKQGRLFIGSTSGRYFCFRAVNGRTIWSARLLGGSRGGSGFSKNTVLTGDRFSNVYAFNIYTGSLKWRTRLESMISSRIIRNNSFLFYFSNHCLYSIRNNKNANKYRYRILVDTNFSLETRSLTTFIPIYMNKRKFRSSFRVEKPHLLKRSGKIYIWGKYLLVSERWKGIHIFDNSNPVLPTAIAFLNIPGNMDIAVYRGILYADSAMDLLAIRLPKGNSKPYLITRIKNAIPFSPKNLLDLNRQFSFSRRSSSWTVIEAVNPKKGIVVAWKKTYRTWLWARNPYAKYSNRGRSGRISSGSSGKGGSMARFTINRNHLYIVNKDSLITFSLHYPHRPRRIGIAEVGRGIETIFPYKQYLFIGSRRAMYAYSIKKNPLQPKFISRLEHMRSFDPVIVSGKYAYVTLRSRWGGQGVLLIIDISIIKKPKLIKRHRISSPWGLAIDKKRLFICTTWGIEIYNVSVPKKLKKQGSLSIYRAFDVIADRGKLIIATRNGISQYRYMARGKFKKLSSITVSR